MSRWTNNDINIRNKMIELVRNVKNITPASIEKDWWVSMILKALFSLPPSSYMYFKGGTSLSKAWSIIDRFSEDIDISLYRDFFLDELGLPYAKCENNNQVKYLRKASREYIVNELCVALERRMSETGIGDVEIKAVTEKMTPDGPRPIDSDSDPVVLLAYYPSVIPQAHGYISPYVKIEISCLSMKEPYEIKRISSLIEEVLPGEDSDSICNIATISPSRTFLEKAFLLNEEYQRKSPRTERMSRHLYDLEKLMDTDYAISALKDMNLYGDIIEHRRRFYHVGGVNYSLNNPETIAFSPRGQLRDKMRTDYETMKESMIYGDRLSFDALISRIEELQVRFNRINI